MVHNLFVIGLEGQDSYLAFESEIEVFYENPLDIQSLKENILTSIFPDKEKQELSLKRGGSCFFLLYFLFLIGLFCFILTGFVMFGFSLSLVLFYLDLPLLYLPVS